MKYYQFNTDTDKHIKTGDIVTATIKHGHAFEIFFLLTKKDDESCTMRLSIEQLDVFIKHGIISAVSNIE